MRISQIIDRIREECPEFAVVDHALTSPASIAYPAAMVVPVEARGNPPYLFGEGEYHQISHRKIGVYVMIARRQDGDADNGAADDFDALCESVRAALMGWAPDARGDVLAYAGGVLAPFAQGSVSWREDFTLSEDLRRIT